MLYETKMMGKKDIISREIEQAEAERLALIRQTITMKQKFVTELKTGLGDEMKNNPNKIIIHINKQSFFKRVLNWIRNIFTKF